MGRTLTAAEAGPVGFGSAARFVGGERLGEAKVEEAKEVEEDMTVRFDGGWEVGIVKERECM